MMRAGAIVAVISAVLVWCMIGTTAAAALPDCSVQFNSLSPCINYVQGSDPAPAPTCCKAFHEVQTTTPVCLCELLQQIQNPSSGLGNATRALDISTLCKVPADVGKCATLLGTPAPAPAILPPPPALPPVSPAPTGAEVDCTAAFNNLSTCLTYVTSNDTQAPPTDCCTALSGVQLSQPVCICQLLAQASNSSQLGINATKALDLPGVCHVKADYNKCPALLGSPVGSPANSPIGSPLGSTAPVALTPVAAVGPSSAASGGVPSSVPETSKPTGAASRQLRPTSKEMLLLTAGALVGLEALFLFL